MDGVWVATVRSGGGGLGSRPLKGPGPLKGRVGEPPLTRLPPSWISQAKVTMTEKLSLAVDQADLIRNSIRNREWLFNDVLDFGGCGHLHQTVTTYRPPPSLRTTRNRCLNFASPT